MDDTTLQVYSLMFVFATVVLVYTARFFQARRGRRRLQRQIAGFEQITQWTTQSIESNKPLHLAFGSAAVGGDNTPAALAGAAFFHQVIEGAQASDAAPIVTMSAPGAIPLGQDTLRRAWHKGDTLSRARWLPPDLAYAGAMTALMADEEPTAHIMAGRFGAELALMLDSASRDGQPSLAVSDRLDGGAVAYAMADHVLLGEELYAAAGYIAEDAPARADAAVLDVWRVLILLGVTALLLLEFSKQLAVNSLPLLAVAVAILAVLGFISYRRR
jgi:hypothetical protein